MSVVRSVDGFEQWDQRHDIEKREIRPGYRRVQLNAASIDPGNHQAERLSADHVGELRLAGMENFVLRHAGMVDEVAEQGPRDDRGDELSRASLRCRRHWNPETSANRSDK